MNYVHPGSINDQKNRDFICNFLCKFCEMIKSNVVCKSMEDLQPQAKRSNLGQRPLDLFVLSNKCNFYFPRQPFISDAIT